MAQKDFKVISGIVLSDADGLSEYYEKFPDGFYEVHPSAENMIPLCKAFIELIGKNVMFFIELPKDTDEFEFDVYELKCTKAVANAIIKRYGELLVNDGVYNFGFADLDSGAEIYFTFFQTVSITPVNKSIDNDKKLRRMIEGLEIPGDNGTSVSVRDKFDPDKDDLASIEIEGENVVDAVENLKEAGLTFAYSTDE
ncbi:MAG: hypothetical protein LUH57_02210 [Ruminococcus sp.]|nr:hypothetical protein [Ruminococcus sp.]